MTRFSSIIIAATFAVLPIGNTASAQNIKQDIEQDIEIAQSVCQSIGQRVAANQGATLLAASETTSNGAPACEVVMLLPASNGERQRREVVIVAR